MNGQLSLRSVAFLDTNTLHYIGIYLEFAKEHNLFPLAKDVSENEKHAAAERVNELAEANLKKSLKQGLEIVYFLATRDLQVQYAPASELELLTGRTRGKAVVSAAKEGVPDRMWSRFPEREVRDRVTLADSSAIKATIDGLASTLEESGIAVKARGHDLMNDAMELAKGINGLVYIEAMDSIIYASALVAQADFLLTSDGYLKDTVNYIHHRQGDSRYRQIRQQLKQLVSQISLEDAEEVQLPSAHTITDVGKVKPSLPVSRSDQSS